MTISAAFNSALSGLTAAGRVSGAISDNIANALTQGYARRSVELASNSATGHGVQVTGLTRHDDPVLTANRRAAEAAYLSVSALSSFQSEYQLLVGGPDDPASIAARLSNFETGLIEAASNPGSKARLDTLAQKASDLARAINSASDGVQTMRTRADRSIGQLTGELNTALQQVQDLNSRITGTRAQVGDTASLLDQRQMLIDRINEIVPVNVIDRDHGQVALYSVGGAILLDGKAAQFGFETTGETLPHMTVEGGMLSGLTLNTQPIRTTGERSAIAGGALAAQFEIRDVLATEAQADLDTVARDLIERFETPGLDATLSIGDPGLFTDAGAAFSPAAETGLAGRISLNSLVDPDRGGESWRFRDGLGAATPGEVGQSRQLQTFGEVLLNRRSLSSSAFGTGQLTASGVAAALLSNAAAGAIELDQRMSFAAATKTETARMAAENGVDTDAELQSLMLVERAYAANARVIEVVEDLLDRLMRI